MSAAPIKVLVIDDEPPIRKLLRMGLSTQGYEILEAPSGKIALELLAQNPALIILDLGLPDIQGHELLRMIRGRNDGVPIVVLSSRGDEAGKVAALDLGADDYLTKPFDTEELLARLRTALRHRVTGDAGQTVVTAGEVEIDLDRRRVRRAGEEVHLSPKEYDVLAELAKRPDRVIGHRQLLRTVWGPAHEEHIDYLRIVVRNLRQKLEADPARPQLLINELGVGYRFVATPSPAP